MWNRFAASASPVQAMREKGSRRGRATPWEAPYLHPSHRDKARLPVADDPRPRGVRTRGQACGPNRRSVPRTRDGGPAEAARGPCRKERPSGRSRPCPDAAVKEWPGARCNVGPRKDVSRAKQWTRKDAATILGHSDALVRRGSGVPFPTAACSTGPMSSGPDRPGVFLEG